MRDRARAMVLASLLGDSLALGVHWIYDTEEIQSRFGRVETLLAPTADSYHAGKGAGESTHYGDQTLALLASIASRSGFDLDHFARTWRELFTGYSGYFDRATKATLANFEEGKGPERSGSASTDLAGAARIAPLVYRYREDLEELVVHARAQTVMTHNDPLVTSGAEFLARVLFAVLRGTAPAEAIRAVTRSKFAGTDWERWVEQGAASTGLGSREAIGRFGQSCAVEPAFLSVVHLVGKYPNHLKRALVENTMAGGDSAGRGLIVGMILGAHLGTAAIPDEWSAAFKRRQDVLDLLDRIG